MLPILVFGVSQISFAVNCKPDSTTTIKVVTDSLTLQDHLYWIDTNSLHVCTAASGAPKDLATTLNLPVAGSPVLAATVNTNPSNSNDIYVFYVDSSGHIHQIVQDNSTTDLTALGLINTAGLWTSLSAVYTYNTLSLTYGVDTNTSADKYGVKKVVFRYDYFFKSGQTQDTNLYYVYHNRGADHLETQVNVVTDGGFVYSTFDPEGQGHIHYISSQPGTSPQTFYGEDLMDDTGAGGMNVTSGGGIINPQNPTCEASGVAPMYNNLNANLFFYGQDSDFHQLYGQGTSWQKRDVTHESGAPLADGCGKFAAALGPTTSNGVDGISLLYEAVMGSGRGLILASLPPGQGAGWTYSTVISPSQGTSTCANSINVMQDSPIAISYNYKTNSNGFYFVDVNGHLYNNCTMLF